MIVGIDYGLAHVGIAAAETPLAEPIGHVATQALLPYLDTYFHTHAVTLVVIGHSTGLMDQPTRELAQTVSDRYPAIEVVLWDETLSSQEASVLIRHKKRSKRHIDHAAAAAVILQDYLDQQP